jgi:uncharacterized protein with GYD domain
MPKYMISGSYTTQSWAAMVDNPQDRFAAAKKLVDNVGGRLESVYFAFGPDDVIAIAELPDDEAAGAVALAIAASGGFSSARTTKLITMEEGQAMMRKAKQAAGAYSPPNKAPARV